MMPMKFVVSHPFAKKCEWMGHPAWLDRLASLFPIPYSLFYSYLSASIGSRFAARIAGIMPLMRPVTTRMIVATITDDGEISS